VPYRLLLKRNPVPLRKKLSFPFSDLQGMSIDKEHCKRLAVSLVAKLGEHK